MVLEISSTVEKGVSGITDDLALILDLCHSRVIIVVPFTSVEVLRIRSVVAEAHTPVMVAHCIQVINSAGGGSRVHKERRDIQSHQGEPNQVRDLLALRRSRRRERVVRRVVRAACLVRHFEALEQQKQNRRGLVQLHTLSREDMLLALPAVPLILRLQFLRLLEIIQAPFQREGRQLLACKPLRALGNSIFILLVLIIVVGSAVPSSSPVTIIALIVLRVVIHIRLIDASRVSKTSGVYVVDALAVGAAPFNDQLEVEVIRDLVLLRLVISASVVRRPRVVAPAVPIIRRIR